VVGVKHFFFPGTTSAPIVVAATGSSIKQAIRLSNENDKPRRTGNAVLIDKVDEKPSDHAGPQSGARRDSGA